MLNIAIKNAQKLLDFFFMKQLIFSFMTYNFEICLYT